MISNLSETNRYALLQAHSQSTRVASQDADAPSGYQGSNEGLTAGDRVQVGLESQQTADHQGERGEAEMAENAREPEAEGNSDAHVANGDEHPDEANRDDKPTPDEHQQLRDLELRDREVRAHEMAHATIGGRFAGRPNYEYERGPDGKRYASGGEVSIDASPVPGDPQATIEKMRVVRSAALAPASPSAQDRSVAADAARTEAQARRELAAEQREEAEAANEARDGTEPNPLYENDGFTAADVGETSRNDSEDGPRRVRRAGDTLSEALNRLRGSQAFVGDGHFGRRNLDSNDG